MSGIGAKEGDRVTVTWGMDSITGTVNYTPCAEGDSWIIVLDDGTIYHVQRFDSICVLSRKAEMGDRND